MKNKLTGTNQTSGIDFLKSINEAVNSEGKDKKVCPRCKKEYTDYPALSRRDNETEICPECGKEEAFEDYGLSDKYNGEQYWKNSVKESDESIEENEQELSNEPTEKDFENDKNNVKDSKKKEIEDKMSEIFEVMRRTRLDSKEMRELTKQFEELQDKLNKLDAGIEESENFDFLNKDAEFRYQLLDRMRGDCKYYLGNGNGHDKYLWAGNVKDQIEDMKKLYNSFPDDEKPEWITMEDINNFEKEMTIKNDESLTTNAEDRMKETYLKNVDEAD